MMFDGLNSCMAFRALFIAGPPFLPTESIDWLLSYDLWFLLDMTMAESPLLVNLLVSLLRLRVSAVSA